MAIRRRIPAGRRRSRDQAQAAAADRETVRLALRAELAIDCFNQRSAIALEKLMDDTVSAYQAALQLAQDRFDGAVAPLSDVAQARTQLETARVQRPKLPSSTPATRRRRGPDRPAPQPQEAEDGLAALRELETEAGRQHAATDAARQTLEMFKNRYKGGVDTYLQVETWQTAALQNERNDIDLLRRRLEATVLLVKALGGGWVAGMLPATASLP